MYSCVYMCVLCMCIYVKYVCVIPGIHPHVPMALWPEAVCKSLCVGNISITKDADVLG